MPPSRRDRPFHVMVKPIGSACNLACTYCYYVSKGRLLYGSDDAGTPRMSDKLLEEFVRQYIAAHRGLAEINFAWQGGEPTLAGLDFFRRAVEVQRRYAPRGMAVTNCIQTNGTLLDDAWGEFLAANRFLVGLSLDGPAELHDQHRVDKAGRPTFGRVMAGLAVLRKHRVEVNALVVVNRGNASRLLDVYRFLRDQAAMQFIQFIPCVERADFAAAAPRQWATESWHGRPAHDLPGPKGLEGHGQDARATVTPWSVNPDEFGSGLCAVFDEWIARDVGRIFVQAFDVALGRWMGLPSSLCVFAERCGGALAMEPDGGVYACDHYVYPEFRRGRLGESSLAGVARGPEQAAFGRAKSDSLPRYCRECEVRFACNGECPKNRFCRTPDGEGGLSYLCSGWRKFFRHVDPWMKRMAAELSSPPRTQRKAGY